MSGTNAAPVQPYRPHLCRVINIFAVVTCTIGGLLNALAGNLAVVGLMLLFVALNAYAIVFNTKAIRRDRPLTMRPDYSAIARMERDIWGQAFEHTGAPVSLATIDGFHALGAAFRASSITLGTQCDCDSCGYRSAHQQGKCAPCYARHKREG